jgi:hypothetical protein
MKFFEKKHPIKRHAYAITTGDYVGEMFIYVSSNDEHHKFLSIPKNINREVPKEKFEFGLEADIIEHVECIPRSIFKIIKAQFYSNENSNNRRQQPNSSDVLDSQDTVSKD